jgi:gliding motility-associated-like protein
MPIKSAISTILTVFLTLSMSAQEISHAEGEFNFYENKGQWPNGVLFKANMPSGNIWIEQGRVLYHFQDYSALHEAHENPGQNKTDEQASFFNQAIVAVNFVGANKQVKTTQEKPTKHYHNYFLGNDETHWASGVRGYNQVKYLELYTGIDAQFFEKEGQLKYEFHIQANTNPAIIQLKYEGYTDIKLNKRGNLEVRTAIGLLEEQKPYAYQIVNGRIVEVSCSFQLTNGVVTFDLGDYEKHLPLVIDPVLVFATYNGAESDNFGMTATYAYDGQAYSGGILFGNLYPVPTPAWNTTPNITIADVGTLTTDVFISKYNEDGTDMVWTNFIGGGDNTVGTETVHSLICDTDNNVYLYGATASTDFPIIGGFQTEHAGGSFLSINSNGARFGTQGTDIFVAKFSADGLDLLGSTYVGGSANDGVNYKLSSGSYTMVSHYDSLTTNYGDQFRGEIMLDSLDNILITSSSWSTDFPVESSFQPTNGGMQDAVIFKIAADFSSLLWSTYYGGSNNDAGYSIKLDSSYNVIFAGGTSSDDLSNTLGGFQSAYNGGKTDGFVCKVTEDGSAIVQSTYVGTISYDQVFFIEVDRWDNIYLVGQSFGGMPTSPDVYSNPGSSQFIWKFNSTLTATEFTTVFGNGLPGINISPSAFLVDVCGNIYVSGWGGSVLGGTALAGMPITADAFQDTPPNGFDFYLMVLEREAQSLLYATYMGGDEAQEHVDGGTSRFDKFGVVYQSVCGGCGGRSDFPTTDDAFSATNESDNCNNLIFKFDFEIIPVADFEVDLLEGCAPLTLKFDNESNDTINFDWDFGPGTEIISGGASPTVLFTEPGTYEVVLMVTDTICDLTDTAVKIITVYEELNLEVPNDTIVCTDINYELVANSFGSAISFIWSDSPDFTTVLNDGAMDSTINVSPTTTTTYYVTATNGWELCDLIDSVTVVFVDGAIELMPDTLVCRNDTAFLYAQNLYPEIDITFDWSPNEFILFEGDTFAYAQPLNSMYFYVTATTDLGCTITDSVWVEVQNLEDVTISATATPNFVPEGGVSQLEALPEGFTYLWLPSTGLDDPTSRTPKATVDETTTYLVYMDNGVCSAIDTVVVKVYEFICGDVYIYVPNAFSPNGDGENEQVFVRGKNIEEIDFKIFNRWGEKVFETNDQAVGWNGTFKGEALDPDVYVYHLRVICFDQQENLIKGNITLLK